MFLWKKKQQKLHLGNVSCTIDKALKVSPTVFLFKNRLLMQCHLIQTMSVHCLRPFKTSIWFMFCYSFFIFSQLFLFLSSSSFFLGGGGGGGGGVISINLGDKEGPLKKFLRKSGGHHILQELLVKSHQLPPNQAKNERSLTAMHCKDLK